MLQAAEFQEETVGKRKELAQGTRTFKAKVSADVAKAVAPLLKDYQCEVDRLTRRYSPSTEHRHSTLDKIACIDLKVSSCVEALEGSRGHPEPGSRGMVAGARPFMQAPVCEAQAMI